VENYNKIVLILTILGFLFNLHAIEGEKDEVNKSLAFYPFGAYSSETSVFLGGYALYRFRPSGIQINAPYSSLELNLIASFKKQLRILLRNKYAFDQGKFAVGIPLRYYNWPTTYYGVGNQEEPDEEENYTREYWEFYPFLEYHFLNNYTLSISAYLEKDRIVDSDEENSLLNKNIPGFEDYFIAGPEFKFERLSTDQEFFPRKGSNIILNFKYYNETFKSDYNYLKVSFDTRKYVTIKKNHTFAGQIFLEGVNGDVPFEELPDLGSQMRGYKDNKYIDNRYVLLRLEDRMFPFDSGKLKRFGMAIFVESGQSFTSFEDVDFGNQKYSAGLGIRWIILPEDMLTLRLDMAFSEDGFEMEIISFEAF